MKTTINKILSAIRRIFTSMTGRPEPRPVAATGAGCERIQELLLHLCGGDEPRALWVKRWLALPLRNPGTKMRTALIVNAENGTGKTLFFGAVAAKLHGEHARHIHGETLAKTFCTWAAGDPRLIVIDGGSPRWVLPKLKSLMTSNTVFLKTPYSDVVDARESMMNFVFLTCHPDPLENSTDSHSRRLFVLEQTQRLPAAFYLAVVDEIAAGGVDAFMSHLMDEIDMGAFNASTPMPPSWKSAEAA